MSTTAEWPPQPAQTSCRRIATTSPSPRRGRACAPNPARAEFVSEILSVAAPVLLPGAAFSFGGPIVSLCGRGLVGYTFGSRGGPRDSVLINVSGFSGLYQPLNELPDLQLGAAGDPGICDRDNFVFGPGHASRSVSNCRNKKTSCNFCMERRRLVSGDIQYIGQPQQLG